METGRGGKEKRGRSEQEGAKEELEAELYRLARTRQQPTERETRQMLPRRTQPHVGSSSQVRVMLVLLAGCLEETVTESCYQIQAFIVQVCIFVQVTAPLRQGEPSGPSERGRWL